jgi:MFS family permease
MTNQPNARIWQREPLLGFLTIYAKFSDISGRKSLILLALSIFFPFSILCGVSNSMVALYNTFLQVLSTAI